MSAEATETTPLVRMRTCSSSSLESADGVNQFDNMARRRESLAADKLTMRLLEVDDDDSETEDKILRESLDISLHGGRRYSQQIIQQGQQFQPFPGITEEKKKAAWERLCSMASLSILAFALIAVALYEGVQFIGPPNQPAGPYKLIERQVGPFLVLFFCVCVCVFFF